MAGQPAGARIARPSRRRTASVVTGAIGVLAIGGGVVAWQQGLFAPTPAPPVPAVAAVEQAPPPVVAAPVSVQLNFMALPSNATVTVDNVSWPGHSGTVRPGLHSYIVTAAGYTSVTDTLTVGESDQTLRLAMTRVPPPTRRTTPPPQQRARPAAPTETGRFLVRANVSAAIVLLDGQRITNGQEIDVPVGRHTISVSAPGYVTFDTTVTVNTIAPVRLPVTLVVSNEL